LSTIAVFSFLFTFLPNDVLCLNRILFLIDSIMAFMGIVHQVKVQLFSCLRIPDELIGFGHDKMHP
jgi:hypothetical protein